jgi:hypothetical protein
MKALENEDPNDEQQDSDDKKIKFATSLTPNRFTKIDIFCALISSGVSSNAHARISAIGKPSAITATKTFIVHGGASKVGNKIDAACSNSQATTA